MEISAAGATVLDATLAQTQAKLKDIDNTARPVFATLDANIAIVSNSVLGLNEATRKTQLELIATQRNASGVAAAYVLVSERAARFSDITKQLTAIRKEFEQGKITAEVALRGMGEMSRQVQEQEQKRQRSLVEGQFLVAAGYAIIVAKLMEYRNAALAVSAEGQRLAFIQERINFAMGGIFAPAIRTNIELMDKLRNRLEHLTGAQQQQIRNVTAMSLGFTGVIALAPVVEFGFTRIGKAVGLLAANPVLAVTAAVVGLVAGTEEGRAAFGKLASAILPLAEVLAKIVTEGVLPFATILGKVLGLAVTALTPLIKGLTLILDTIGPTIAMITVWAIFGIVLNKNAVAIWGTVTALYAKAKAATTAAAAMGLLTAATTAATTAAKALWAALGPVGLAVLGIGAIVSFFSMLFGSKKKEDESLTRRTGGFESFEASYNRIQEAIMQSGSVPRQQLEELRGIRRAVERRDLERPVVRA